MARLFLMLPDFVSLPLPPLSFLLILPFLPSSLSLSISLHLNLSLHHSLFSVSPSLTFLLLQLSLSPFISVSIPVPLLLWLFYLQFPSSSIPTSFLFPLVRLLFFFALHRHLFFSASLSLSLFLVSPTLSSICATIPLSQLRSQLFPASAPAFPWRGSPALPRAPSLPRFGGQPADVAQHLLLLHRQGEVMSRLANSVPSEYVCVSVSRLASLESCLILCVCVGVSL